MATPIYYTEFYSEAIDTKDLYYAIRANRENIERELLIEFRDRLEDLLFEKKLISVHFHPLHWRYHRSKFLSWVKNYRYNEEKDNNVFRIDYFLRDAKHGNNVRFSSLDDDEKIQIVVPKVSFDSPESNEFIKIFDFKSEFSKFRFNPWVKSIQNERNRIIPEFFQNLKSERKKEILYQLENGKRHVSKDDKENPYEWYRWGYDLYSLYESYELSFEEDRKDFEFFFAWRLSITDLFLLNPFLHWHLNYSFAKNTNSYREFISILLLKYDRIITNPHIVSKASEFVKEMDEFTKNSGNNEMGLEVEKDTPQKAEQLSTAQTVLAFMILDIGKPFSKSQDRKPLQNFISVVSRRDFRIIGNHMASFCPENSYLAHKSKRKNLEDYKMVRVFFEKMENRKALEFIDNQINTISKLKE